MQDWPILLEKFTSKPERSQTETKILICLLLLLHCMSVSCAHFHHRDPYRIIESIRRVCPSRSHRDHYTILSSRHSTISDSSSSSAHEHSSHIPQRPIGGRRSRFQPRRNAHQALTLKRHQRCRGAVLTHITIPGCLDQQGGQLLS